MKKVPYYTICSCNPDNGGSGMCGCTMANKLVEVSDSNDTSYSDNFKYCPHCGHTL